MQKGLEFSEIWKKKKTGPYGKYKVNFIGINELVRSKNISKRKQDKIDLEILLSVLNRKSKN